MPRLKKNSTIDKLLRCGKIAFCGVKHMDSKVLKYDYLWYFCTNNVSWRRCFCSFESLSSFRTQILSWDTSLNWSKWGKFAFQTFSMIRLWTLPHHMHCISQLRRALYIAPALPLFTNLPHIFVGSLRVRPRRGNFLVAVLLLLLVMFNRSEFEYCQIIHFQSSWQVLSTDTPVIWLKDIKYRS